MLMHVLLIDGDPDERLRVREALAASGVGPFDLEECDQLSEGLARLQRGGIEVVVLGPSPSDSDGAAAADRLREVSPHVAIVELVGSGASETRAPAPARTETHDGLTMLDIDARLFGIRLRDAFERARLGRELETQTAALTRLQTELQDLAHVVSHDLREPLRMVGSYVQLLTQRYAGKLDDEGNRFIHYVVDGAARMKSMIDDLLRYSRIGRGELEREAVALGEVFEEVVVALSREIQEAGARVHADALPTVSGSRGPLAQVFQNVIGNALQYRSAAPPEIHVSATRDAEHWTLSIADNGIGFDPAQAERIFRPFQRLHGRGEFSGNGIGLALVRRIVERHGGRAWAESEPGIGSVFHFSLPSSEDSENGA